LAFGFLGTSSGCGFPSQGAERASVAATVHASRRVAPAVGARLALVVRAQRDHPGVAQRRDQVRFRVERVYVRAWAHGPRLRCSFLGFRV